MILDKLLEFDPAGTAITVTAPSTNVLDLHSANMIPLAAALPGRDMGAANSGPAIPRLAVMVQATFTAGGAGTLQVQFQGAPDNGAGAPGAYVTYIETPALALAALVIGNRIFDIDVPRVLPVPNTPALLPRFIRLNYVVATGPMLTGTVQSELVLGRDDNYAYQAGITIAN